MKLPSEINVWHGTLVEPYQVVYTESDPEFGQVCRLKRDGKEIILDEDLVLLKTGFNEEQTAEAIAELRRELARL